MAGWLPSPQPGWWLCTSPAPLQAGTTWGQHPSHSSRAAALTDSEVSRKVALLPQRLQIYLPSLKIKKSTNSPPTLSDLPLFCVNSPNSGVPGNYNFSPALSAILSSSAPARRGHSIAFCKMSPVDFKDFPSCASPRAGPGDPVGVQPLFPSQRNSPGFGFPGLAGNARGWGMARLRELTSFTEDRSWVEWVE